MKKYLVEIVMLICQVFLFYIFPLIALDVMGMVFVIIVATFMLSVLVGILSKNKFKYLYAVVCAILFVPSVFIYYNKTALIHALWYFVVSIVGVVVGQLFSLVIDRK